MKKIFLFSVLLICSFIVQSQSLIINDTIYKPGIYRTFEEFKYNNPSLEFKYEITTRNRGYGFLNSAGQVTFYRIVIDKKVGKSIGEVYGFSDGKSVYINEELPRLGPKAEFSKIEYFAKYCYFEDIFYTTIYNGTSTTTAASLDEKIIDINTGVVISLNKQTLRDLLANDSELLDEFNSEKHKNKKLKEYVIRYLQKQK